MPERPLPRALVSRLRKSISRFGEERFVKQMGRMRNIDYRASLLPKVPKNNTRSWGFRVREIDVSRTHPGSVVLKRVQLPYTAEMTIREVKKRVTSVMKTKPTLFVMKMPFAYAVSENIVAMAKTYKPATTETSGALAGEYWTTDAGKQFLAHLLEKHGLEESDFLAAVDAARYHRSGFDARNLLLLGYSARQKKFVLMPLIDLA